LPAKRLVSRVLSPRQFDEGESRGKISPEGRDPKLKGPAKVDPDAAVQVTMTKGQ